MTDSKFQELVLTKLDNLDGRADRLENGQAELHLGLRDLTGKVDRVLEILRGMATARTHGDGAPVGDRAGRRLHARTRRRPVWIP